MPHCEKNGPKITARLKQGSPKEAVLTVLMLQPLLLLKTDLKPHFRLLPSQRVNYKY